MFAAVAWASLLQEISPTLFLHHPSWFHRFHHPSHLLLRILLRIDPCVQLLSAAGLCNYLHILAGLLPYLGYRHRCNLFFIQKKRALKYPALYDSLQESNQLSALNFMSWIWKATLQGALIMLLSIIFFRDDSYL